MRRQRLSLALATLGAFLPGVGALTMDPTAFGPWDRLWGERSMEALPPIRDLSPIYWVHVPKAGSSFATLLAHYACGSALSNDSVILEPHADSVRWTPPKDPGTKIKGYCDHMKQEHCATLRWNYHCGAASFLYFDSAHYPLPAKFPEDDLHHVAAFVRDPLQRGISGWVHDKHDCQTAKTPDDYLECTKNCQTQLFSGLMCGYDTEPTNDDYKTALRRLGRIGFLGITSQWDLSVCLFHAMHGGMCKPVEFHNLRPGKFHSEDVGYNSTVFNVTLTGEQAVLSGYDAKLYVEAEKLFWSRIKEYGVTRESCASSYCVTSSEFFQVRNDAPEPKFGGTMEQGVTWRGRYSFDED